jgi:hypothetical protein
MDLRTVISTQKFGMVKRAVWLVKSKAKTDYCSNISLPSRVMSSVA